ncbi:MAG TPA: ABATE domain-containing protein [Vicinamibacterales bacterium]
MVTSPYRFDFCGGHVAIDFTNTVGDRGAEPKEHFNTFGDILAWAEARGVITRRAAAALRRQAASDPEGARRAHRHAVELREALYRVLEAAASKRQPAARDLDALNAFVSATFEGAALSRSGARFTLETPPGRGLDDVLRPVVRAAVDLLTSEHVEHIGCCADDSCAWLFLDTTRSRTRRWCDMKACGNRNKVRRFRAG